MRLVLIVLTGAVCGGIAGVLAGRWLVEHERERWPGVVHGL